MAFLRDIAIKEESNLRIFQSPRPKGDCLRSIADVFEESDFPEETVPQWIDVLQETVTVLKDSPKIRETFATLSTNSECALLCFLNDTVTASIEEYLDVCKDALVAYPKNATKAATLRARGDAELEKKAYLKALIIYSRALMFAPAFDEAPLLYERRSVVYYHMEQYENALEDIERAVKLGYAQLVNNSIGSLLIRKAECLLRLGRGDEAREMFDNEALSPAVGTPESSRWKQLKALSSITNRKVPKRDVNLSKFQDPKAVIDALVAAGKFKSNEQFPWLNAKVDLSYTTEKGFQLTSNGKFEFGEVAAVGKPFAGNCIEVRQTSGERCSNCFAPWYSSCALATPDLCEPADIRAALKLQRLPSGPVRVFCPLPCTECSVVLYCSENCRSEAWTRYHRFECAHSPLLSQFDTARLALRMLYSAGSLETVRQVANDWEAKSDQDRLEMMKNPRDYAFVYSMRLPEIRNLKEELAMTINACFLTKLAQLAGFVPNTIADEFFAITILLRHQLQLKVGSLEEITKNIRTDAPVKLSLVDGVVNLIERSCHLPNVTTVTLDSKGHVFQSNVNLLFTTSTVESGSQLHLPSPFFYSEVDYFHVEERRSELMACQRGIFCRCIRCECEYRDRLASPDGPYYPLACPSCGSLMSRPLGTANLEAPLRCTRVGCKKRMPFKQMQVAYGKIDRLLSTVRDMVAQHRMNTQRLDPVALGDLLNQVNANGHLLCRSSPYLNLLYTILFGIYLEEFKRAADPLKDDILEVAWLYAQKMLEVVESFHDGSGKNSGDVKIVLTHIFLQLQEIMELFGVELRVRFPAVVKQYWQFKKRLDAIEKTLAFDQIVTQAEESSKPLSSD